MKSEIDNAIVNAKRILRELEDLKKSYEQSLMFDEEELVTFVRRPANTYNNRYGRRLEVKDGWSVWYVVLDETRNQYAVKGRTGFTTVGKTRKQQTVLSTRSNAEMLNSNDEASRKLAIAILDQLADSKYKTEKDE